MAFGGPGEPVSGDPLDVPEPQPGQSAHLHSRQPPLGEPLADGGGGAGQKGGCLLYGDELQQVSSVSEDPLREHTSDPVTGRPSPFGGVCVCTG